LAIGGTAEAMPFPVRMHIPVPAPSKVKEQRTGVSAPHVRGGSRTRLSLLHKNVGRIFSGDGPEGREPKFGEIDSGK
jgi:hypothetical protein